MINISTDMVVQIVLPNKSEKGNEYKKIKLEGIAGTVITCIFPDDKVYTTIEEGQRRHITLVSRIYNGKEKLFVNIKDVVVADNPCPFGEIEGSLEEGKN